AIGLCGEEGPAAGASDCRASRAGQGHQDFRCSRWRRQGSQGQGIRGAIARRAAAGLKDGGETTSVFLRAKKLNWTSTRVQVAALLTLFWLSTAMAQDWPI